MDRRSLPIGVHLLAGLFVALAAAVWVIGDTTAAQLLLPVALAVALGVLVALLMARTDRFRFLLAMLGWTVTAFAAGGLARDGETAFLIAALLYPAVLLESTRFFDFAPQRHRDDAGYRRGRDATS